MGKNCERQVIVCKIPQQAVCSPLLSITPVTDLVLIPPVRFLVPSNVWPFGEWQQLYQVYV